MHWAKGQIRLGAFIADSDSSEIDEFLETRNGMVRALQRIGSQSKSLSRLPRNSPCEFASGDSRCLWLSC
jgi:hypothetical protein